MDETNVPKDSAQLKKLNRWLMGMVAFMLIWSIALFFYVDKRTESIKSTAPVVMIDSTTGKITNRAYLNLFPRDFTASPAKASNPSKTNDVAKPMYEQKESYEKMDFVIINYFFVEGLIVDKKGNNYTVMYKDYNRVLQTIIVPKEMLLSPTSSLGVNPVSLIAP